MKFKRKRSDADRGRRDRPNQPKKKAPRGPAKRDARGLPERPRMIAAARRRNEAAPPAGSRRVSRWSRNVDPAANRGLERALPPLRRAGRVIGAAASASAAFAGPKLRPLAAWFFRGLALAERAVRWTCALGVRLASEASEVITPRRTIGVTIAATGGLLL